MQAGSTPRVRCAGAIAALALFAGACAGASSVATSDDPTGSAAAILDDRETATGPPADLAPSSSAQQQDRSEPVAGGDDDGMTSSGLERMVDLAVTDLAARLGIARAQVSVATAEKVTWSDASLGCPRPDMRYAQVPVDGVKIVLTAGGMRYSYHAGGQTTEPFLCVPSRRGSQAPPVLQPRLDDTDRGSG